MHARRLWAEFRRGRLGAHVDTTAMLGRESKDESYNAASPRTDVLDFARDANFRRFNFNFEAERSDRRDKAVSLPARGDDCGCTCRVPYAVSATPDTPVIHANVQLLL